MNRRVKRKLKKLRRNLFYSVLAHALLLLFFVQLRGSAGKLAQSGNMLVEVLTLEEESAPVENIASPPVQAIAEPAPNHVPVIEPAEVQVSDTSPEKTVIFEKKVSDTFTKPIARVIAAPVISGGEASGDGAESVSAIALLPLAQDYQRVLLRWLMRHQRPLHMHQQQEGVVRVRVEIDRVGNVHLATLASSSGQNFLDESALALVHASNPFPQMPAELDGERFSFIAPIRFKLQ